MDHIVRLTKAFIERYRRRLRHTLRLETIELEPFVATSHEAFRQAWRDRVHWTLSLEPELRVRADAQLLDECLSELLSNAGEALRGAGRIVIAARRDGAWVELVVEDDGPGMDDLALAHRQTLFVSTGADGVGMGLPLVKQWVGEMGGRFELRRAETHGTCAVLRRPLAESPR